MLRLLVFLSIVSACSVAIPVLYQSNPEAFHRNLSIGAERVRKLVSTQDKAPVTRHKSLSGRKVRIEMDPLGHFVTEFRLNGRRITALVDTGATLVAINTSTARRIGIRLSPSDFKYEVGTANGKTRAASVTIDSVQIGRIRVDEVHAAVLDDDALEGTLVGMSFLKRLRTFKVENGSLLLRQ
jgi:aspartyl protease family protein